MMKMVPINSAIHRALRVRESRGFPHAKNQHMTVLAACEIMSSSMNYPVIFTKHPDTGRFLCLALFGLESGENLFSGKEQWNATYIPMNITRTPFAMSDSGKGDDTMLICIDEDSPYVSETEGAALFDKDGNQTEFLNNVATSLSEMTNHERHTELFIKKLVEFRLLVPISIVMTDSGEKETELLDDAYTISEGHLRELPEERLLDLHKADYLGPIYSLINSLELFNRMVTLRNVTTNNPITNIQVKYSN
jgi:hypothetical protein